MPELELTKITFTKGELKQLPEKEVVFIMQLANVLQEVSVLHKLIAISVTYAQDATDAIEARAQYGQTMFFHRILAGVLFEGWTMTNSKRYREVLGTYCPDFGNEANQSLENLRDYFGKKNNLIERLRHKFSYHYNFGCVRDCLRNLPDSEQLDMFIAPEHGNCRYTASDKIIDFAILRTINQKDKQAAMETLVEEVLAVAHNFVDFAGECILIFARRCPEFGRETLVLKDAPKLDSLRLNYFVHRPSD